ncbi:MULTISPECIES: pPIWI_RE module domain-containing protein [Aerosakkonema]|uniref:pPIWI_RE module domain-containing protein n=1 Tax=Aerosakkonema TaxID=1246629 RepID=UPI0035B7ABCF
MYNKQLSQDHQDNSSSQQQQEKYPPVNELQALGWIIDGADLSIFGNIYTLELPPSWVDLLNPLAHIDETPPIRSLYAAIKGCAPNITYIFPGSFRREPNQRPPYWLAATDRNGLISISQLGRLIRTWLRENYEHPVAQKLAKDMQPALDSLKWQPLDLNSAPINILQSLLPHLVARWLTTQKFRLGLHDSKGHESLWNLVYVADPDTNEATLVTWHPDDFKHPKYAWQGKVSFYIRLRLAPSDGKTPNLLLMKAGVRRYLTRPLVEWDITKNCHKIRFPKGQRSSAYLAVTEVDWMKEEPLVAATTPDTTLVKLKLARHDDLHWEGRLGKILSNFTSIEIPEPQAFLQAPLSSAPQLLIVYRNTFGSYAVKAGIEAADRYELFKRISRMMPVGIKEAPIIDRIDIKRQSKKRLTSRTRPLVIPPSTSSSTYHIQIACTQKEIFVNALREILSSKKTKGKLTQVDERSWDFTNQLGQCYRVNISLDSLPEEHIASLYLQNKYSKGIAAAANQSRASRIEADLKKSSPLTNTKHGIIVELLDYRKVKSKERLKDPKPGIRWGYAYNGTLLQFFAPNEQITEIGLHKKCLNTTLDLLRQLNFPLGIPFYTGLYNTQLPDRLDILGIYIIRLNARNFKEDNVNLPIVILLDGDYLCSQVEVYLPSEHGPIRLPYNEALLQIANLERHHSLKYDSDQILNFIECVFRDYPIKRPTLLMFDDQNIRKDLPDLCQTPGNPTQNDWHTNLLPMKGLSQIRVARLRYSSNNLVSDLCPLSNFNRYSGLYHNPDFSTAVFSIGRSPQSAKRPTASRKRDRMTKPGWNQSVLEIQWLCLQPGDNFVDWSVAVHRLRESSPFLDLEITTAFPQPLHQATHFRDYITRLETESEENSEDLEIEFDDNEAEDEVISSSIEQLRLF